VLTVSATQGVGAAADLLQESRVRGLVVEDAEWPVGVFTQTEALAASKLDPTTPVEEVMSCALLCLPLKLPLFRAAAFALQTRARTILAVASRDLHGIVSGLDMARAVACHLGSARA
jgi:CBS domain-containing protein